MKLRSSFFRITFFFVSMALSACSPKTMPGPTPSTPGTSSNPAPKPSDPSLAKAQPGTDGKSPKNPEPPKNPEAKNPGVTSPALPSTQAKTQTPATPPVPTEPKVEEPEPPVISNAYLGFVSIPNPKQFLPFIPKKDFLKILTSASLEEELVPNFPIVFIFWEPNVGVAEIEKKQISVINQFPSAIFVPFPEESKNLKFLLDLLKANQLRLSQQKYAQGTFILVGENTEILFKRDFSNIDAVVQAEIQGAATPQTPDINFQFNVESFFAKYGLPIEHFLLGDGQYLISSFGKKAYQRFSYTRDKNRFQNKALNEFAQALVPLITQSLLDGIRSQNKTIRTEISHPEKSIRVDIHFEKAENKEAGSFTLATNQNFDLLPLLPKNGLFRFQQNSLWEVGPPSPLPCGLAQQYRYAASTEALEKIGLLCQNWEQNLQGLRFAVTANKNNGFQVFAILAPTQPDKFWETLDQTIDFFAERENLKNEFTVTKKEKMRRISFTHQKLTLFTLTFLQTKDKILVYFGKDVKELGPFQKQVLAQTGPSLEKEPLFQETGLLYGNVDLGAFFSVIGKASKEREGTLSFYNKGDGQTQDIQIQFPQQGLRSFLGTLRKKVLGK